ncbi:phosphotransferase [Pseudonocardia sp. EC080610-09]|uniref:HPr family phosphocarrier protein n=1 Tax=unclassified Pseudonocardia TaxID=2619320 RepID=UPI0006CB7961|nr:MULTISPECIES: HPr family phosphocarrier protein [unclassified Pseudonocardia]ALE75344.1 phosphotransferase [Pseudonocardia sp. EC080625-04]ALL74702.1 phosphotransferase [Pseudonocardia sp. EC080610-09]ALL81725.1 phosphotransferase [Pseudonocardia sp. EC080619-01]
MNAERTAVVASEVGLHARPAAVFARAAKDTGLPVTIALDGGEPVDATSVLSVLTLGAGHGQRVTLRAEGDGAAAALDHLAGLLESTG